MKDENFDIIKPTAEKTDTSAKTVPPIGNPKTIPSFIFSRFKGDN